MEKLKGIQVKNAKFINKPFKLSDGGGLYLPRIFMESNFPYYPRLLITNHLDFAQQTI